MPLHTLSPQDKSKLWSFLLVLSCIVGLVCSAQSLSSKHISEERNFCAIFLHIIIGLFILGFLLFTDKINVRRSFMVKSHVVFSVLMFTSFYSFFYDKYVKEADAYSIVSNVAFAFMSLCFSRKLETGFEGGFLQFFLQNLTIQLMKIKLILVFIAAVYCYSLVFFCCYLDSQQENEAPGIEDCFSVIIESANGETQPSPSIEEYSSPTISRDRHQNSENYSSLSLQESLPRQVRTPTVLIKYVRVTGIDDGDEEGAYQATVKVAGHVFKGFLYDQGLEDGYNYPNLTELPLGDGSAGGHDETGGVGGARRDGATTSSPMLDPSDVPAAPGGNHEDDNVTLENNVATGSVSDSQHPQLRKRTQSEAEDGSSFSRVQEKRLSTPLKDICIYRGRPFCSVECMKESGFSSTTSAIHNLTSLKSLAE